MTPETVEQARLYTLSMLRVLRTMKDDLPDGQWEDGPEELCDELCEQRPDKSDPVWLEYANEVRDNVARWL